MKTIAVIFVLCVLFISNANAQSLRLKNLDSDLSNDKVNTGNSAFENSKLQELTNTGIRFSDLEKAEKETGCKKSSLDFTFAGVSKFSFTWGDGQGLSPESKENNRFAGVKTRIIVNKKWGGFIAAYNTQKETFVFAGPTILFDANPKDVESFKLRIDGGVGNTFLKEENQDGKKTEICGIISTNIFLNNVLDVSALAIFANRPIKLIQASVMYRPISQFAIGIGITKYYPRSIEWGPELQFTFPIRNTPVLFYFGGGVGFMSESNATGNFGAGFILKTNGLSW